MNNDFKIRNLHVMAYAGGFTNWVYNDPKAESFSVMLEDFFKPARDMVKNGDIITCVIEEGTFQRYVKIVQDKVFLMPLL